MLLDENIVLDHLSTNMCRQVLLSLSATGLVPNSARESQGTVVTRPLRLFPDNAQERVLKLLGLFQAFEHIVN